MQSTGIRTEKFVKAKMSRVVSRSLGGYTEPEETKEYLGLGDKMVKISSGFVGFEESLRHSEKT